MKVTRLISGRVRFLLTDPAVCRADGGIRVMVDAVALSDADYAALEQHIRADDPEKEEMRKELSSARLYLAQMRATADAEDRQSTDSLRAVIVSQALEIARLKGEIE